MVVTAPGAGAPGAQSRLSTRAPAARPPLGSSSVRVAKTTRPDGVAASRTPSTNPAPPGAGGTAIDWAGPKAPAPSAAVVCSWPCLVQATMARPPRPAADAESRSTSVASVVAGPKPAAPGARRATTRPPRFQPVRTAPPSPATSRLCRLVLGVALVSCCGAPAAADHTNSWRLLLVAGSASHATTSPPRSSWSTRTSSNACRLVAIVCGALPPTRSSRRLTPPLTRSSRITGTRSGRASTPRRNVSELVSVVTCHAAWAGAAAPSATRAAPSAAMRALVMALERSRRTPR